MAGQQAVVQRVGQQAQALGEHGHRPGDDAVAAAGRDGAKGPLGKGLGRHQERHRIGVARRQRRGHITRQQRDHAHAAGAAFHAQALAVGHDAGLAGAVGAVPRQAADGRDAGHAHQRARATCAHRRHEGVEGGRQAHVVEREHLAHHVEVGALGGVHADADAGGGHHHVGQALRGDAASAGRDDGIGVGHVGAVHGRAPGAQALRAAPGLQQLGAPRHQRQPPAGLGVARRQRLADAAGSAGDESQRCRHRQTLRASPRRGRPRLLHGASAPPAAGPSARAAAWRARTADRRRAAR
jgi:hypothetical protein